MVPERSSSDGREPRGGPIWARCGVAGCPNPVASLWKEPPGERPEAGGWRCAEHPVVGGERLLDVNGVPGTRDPETGGA